MREKFIAVNNETKQRIAFKKTFIQNSKRDKIPLESASVAKLIKSLIKKGQIVSENGITGSSVLLSQTATLTRADCIKTVPQIQSRKPTAQTSSFTRYLHKISTP